MVTKSCTALLDTIVQMRSEGLETPYVVFWNRSETDVGWATAQRVYTEFMANEKYADCWVYWNGKPLMALTSLIGHSTSGFAAADKLTLRQITVAILSRTLKQNEWTFLHDSSAPCKDSSGEYEQISVYVARQTTYMSVTSTAIGRNGGKTFYNQWLRAFRYRPKIVSVTWWNEWAAQRFEVDTNGDGV